MDRARRVNGDTSLFTLEAEEVHRRVPVCENARQEGGRGANETVINYVLKSDLNSQGNQSESYLPPCARILSSPCRVAHVLNSPPKMGQKSAIFVNQDSWTAWTRRCF